MTTPDGGLFEMIALVGALVIASTLVRLGLDRVRLPPVAGYILLGLGLSLVDYRLGLLSTDHRHALEVLAGLGVVVLLFRVGLESTPTKLVRQLPKAAFGLIGSVVPSALLGYGAARFLLGTSPVAALFVATALTATSVAVSLAPWREAGVLDSDAGTLLLDLAELDDVTGILLMAVLLGLVPLIAEGGPGALPRLGVVVAWLLAGLAGLLALCVLVGRYAEARLTAWLRERGGVPDIVLVIGGLGLVIAALAGWLGFSLAIGGFFAGLAFSGDPGRTAIDRGFGTLFEFLTPFFFIEIGLAVDVGVAGRALGVGAVLLVVAVAGKVLGGLAVVRAVGWTGGLLIGVSMVPRAEIAMIIMAEGRRLGAWAVPDELFSGMVVVSLGTSVLAAVATPLLLARARESGAGGDPTRTPRGKGNA